MKKSSSVSLGLLAAVAMAVTTGCRRNEVRDCVDQGQRLVDERNCLQQDEQRSRGYSGVYPYRWMYGGRSGGHIGDSVVGGHSSPSPGVGSVSRGGFGHSFSGVSS